MKELLVICKLVRMSVFGTEEDLPTCVNWQKVFSDAGLNCVSAICYEAVKRLPVDRQPDFDLMLRWDLSAQGIREGFHHRHEVMLDFRSILESRGISMVLLKGETLADYYPQPDLRESGDVDFIPLKSGLTESGFDECNAIVGNLGLWSRTQPKHVAFRYDGILFESHDPSHTKDYNASSNRTYELLNSSLKDVALRPDGCWELEPVMQALFTLQHMAQHICYTGGRITLRMLLDLALLLKRHPDILGKWEPGLRKVGLYSFSRVVLCVVDQLLGTGFGKVWGGHMKRRARRFTYLFLTESNTYLRYIAKFTYLPLRPAEMLRLWYERAQSLMFK